MLAGAHCWCWLGLTAGAGSGLTAPAGWSLLLLLARSYGCILSIFIFLLVVGAWSDGHHFWNLVDSTIKQGGERVVLEKLKDRR